MSFTILSPYRFFLIDEENKLWALMKDKRLSFLKQIPAFATFSSDRRILTGVSFRGEKTDIIWERIDFCAEIYPPIFSERGYCYYPTLLNKPKTKLALLKADLLNKSGTSDLIVFQKARTKYHPIQKSEAALTPPAFDHETEELYFISALYELKVLQGDSISLLAPKATKMTFCSSKKMIAFTHDDYIEILNIKTGDTQKFIAFDVTALSFDVLDDFLYFSTFKQGKSALYQYSIRSGQIDLISDLAHQIVFLSG